MVLVDCWNQIEKWSCLKWTELSWNFYFMQEKQKASIKKLTLETALKIKNPALKQNVFMAAAVFSLLSKNLWFNLLNQNPNQLIA